MSKPIKSPLLRLLLAIFGNTSVQLYPVCPNRPSSLVNLFWNLSVFVFATRHRFKHSSVRQELNKRDPLLGGSLNSKPLFALLSELTFNYVSQCYLLCNVLYFIWLSYRNDSLIQLLDSFPVVKHSSSKTRRIVCYILLVQQLSIQVPMFLSERHRRILFTASWCEVLHKLVLHFIGMNHFSIGFLITLYYQWATLQSLSRIKVQYSITGNLRQMRAGLAQLASAHRRLNRRLALPLLLFTLLHSIEFVIILSSLWMKHFTDVLGYLSFAVDFLIMLTCMAVLQAKVTAKVRQLAVLLEQRPSRHLANRLVHSREMQTLYLESFQLKVFQLFSINGSFIVGLVLFLLQHVLLVTQTST